MGYRPGTTDTQYHGGHEEGEAKNEAYCNVVRYGNIMYAMIENIKIKLQLILDELKVKGIKDVYIVPTEGINYLDIVVQT